MKCVQLGQIVTQAAKLHCSQINKFRFALIENISFRNSEYVDVHSTSMNNGFGSVAASSETLEFYSSIGCLSMRWRTSCIFYYVRLKVATEKNQVVWLMCGTPVSGMEAMITICKDERFGYIALSSVRLGELEDYDFPLIIKLWRTAF